MVEETGSSSRVGAVRVTLVIQSDTAPPSRSPHMEGKHQKKSFNEAETSNITISQFTFSYNAHISQSVHHKRQLNSVES